MAIGSYARRPSSASDRSWIPPVVEEVLRSPAGSLDAGIRTTMGLKFGHDFSRVRVHTDEKATQSARAMNAVAYTAGSDVVFAAGQYRPHTYEGRALLAHELSHVVQQEGARPGSALGILPDHSSAEREARLSASAVMQGMPAHPVVSRGQPVAIACQAAPALMPVPPPAPVRPPLTVIQGGQAEPGVEPFEVPQGPRYATEPDNSFEAIMERADLERQRYLDIMQAETPVATLDRGAKPPDFVTVDGEQDGWWSWGRAKYRRRGFHVLDAIEYAVGRAKTDDDLTQVLVAYVGYIPAPGQWRPSPLLPIWPTQIIFPDDLDPGGEKRMAVYAAAVARRTGAVPRLGTARAVPRVPENARRRGCKVVPAAPLGDDPLASIYCQVATGSLLEYKVTTPYGEWAQFDGMSGDTVFECKCGYRSLVENYEQWVKTGKPWWAGNALSRRDEQMLRQQRVAGACGLRLLYYVSNKGVAGMLNDRWDGNPLVIWYPWDECG